MTKQEFVNAVAENHTNLTKAEVERVISSTFDTLTLAMKNGDKVSWPGFGSFSTSERAARKGRNPQTGKEIDIAASKAVKFKAASKLKEQL